MKKFLLSFLPFLVMALCVASFTSCSDDDDADGAVNNSIVGTWVQEDVEEYSGYITTETTTFVFNADGTGSRTMSSVTKDDTGDTVNSQTVGPSSFSYSYNADTRELILMYSTRMQEYTATVMGSRMLLQDSSGNYDFTRR